MSGPATDLPWRLDRSNSDRRSIRSAERSIPVCAAINSAIDARYIVTACNAFPALYEALERCLADCQFSSILVWEQVRAALAQARGDA